MSRVTRSLLIIMVGIGAASPVLCAAQGNNTGAVFIMTNHAKKNQVIAYERAANGTLSEPVYYDTNGRGSGGTTDPSNHKVLSPLVRITPYSSRSTREAERSLSSAFTKLTLPS